MPPPPGRRTLPFLAAGAVVTLLMVALCVWPPQLLVFLEGKIYDSFLRSAARRGVTGSIAIVDLDEASIATLGQWPWPRYRVARLLTRIRDAGAVAVGLDMLFAEPDRTSLTSLSGEIRRDLGVEIDIAGLPDETLDSDRALAEAMRGGPFVLGYQFDFDGARGETCFLHPLRTAVRATPGSDGPSAFFAAPGVICNLPLLARSAGASGFFNVTPDPDGVVRRVPVAIRHGGQLYPSLALALYLRARPGEAAFRVGQEGVESMRLDGKDIPLDGRGNLLVNYRGGRRTFPHVSAADLLDNTAAPDAIRGKIVLFGTTAAGLHEMRTTPLSPAQPGVEIHATVLDDLLAGDPIARPPWSRGLLLVLVVVPGLLLTALLSHARAAWALAAVLPAVAGIWLGSGWLLSARQVFLPPLLPVAALATVFTVLTSLRFLQADREVRERNRKLALTQDAIIQSLAALAETRHHETGGHIQRTRHYMRALAMRLRERPRFRDYLDDSTVDLLFRLAPLHDIGKVGVPDQILLKPAALTVKEYEIMKRHTVYGSQTIRMARSFLGEDTFLQVADEIALNHHERWDGTGYPRRLRGDDIPIAGRMMAAADAYDAIISPRLYKPALPHEEAVRILRELRGVFYDPVVVDAFLEVSEEFRQIASRFASGGVEPEPPAGI